MKLLYTPKPGLSSIGMHETPSAAAAASPHCPSTQARSASALPQIGPPYPPPNPAQSPQKNPVNEPHAQLAKESPISPSLAQILPSSWQW